MHTGTQEQPLRKNFRDDFLTVEPTGSTIVCGGQRSPQGMYACVNG